MSTSCLRQGSSWPPKGVIFDLFRTLTSVELSGAPGHNTHALLGVSAEAWSTQLRENAAALALGQVVDSVAGIRALAHAIDPQISLPVIVRAATERKRRFGHAVLHPCPETLEGLERLRRMGLRLGLCSNAWHDEIHMWDQSPLALLLDAVVFSCRVGLQKPDPRIYALAAQRLGVAANECLFVGDGESDELRGARNAGMCPVLITNHLAVLKPEAIGPRAALADLIVSGVKDLVDRLESAACTT